MNVGHIVSLLAFAIACACALSLGHRVAHFTASRTLVTLVLPASFVLLGTLGLLYVFFSQSKSGEPAFVGALCSIAAGSVFAWLFITRSVSDEQARDTGEQLAAASEQLAAQQEYCRTLELSRSSAAKLKTENMARFQEVARSLDKRDASAALQLLHKNRGSLGLQPYAPCKNAAVAALLSAKRERCLDLGVSWHCDVDVPEFIGLSPLTLCEVFSNMLDNAIREAAASGAADPSVEVRARPAAGYLVVKVKNNMPKGTGTGPSKKEPDEKPTREILPEHGWGRQILSRIAKEHDGEVRVDKTDESWVTEAFLSLSEE